MTTEHAPLSVAEKNRILDAFLRSHGWGDITAGDSTMTTETLTGRALDARVAEVFDLPLEPPCGRYHSTDEALRDEDGWSGYCYTCSDSIHSVIPEPLRYSSDMIAVGLLEDEIERRGLESAYVMALRRIVTPVWPEDAARWALIRATPEERCRAALAAVGGAP